MATPTTPNRLTDDGTAYAPIVARIDEINVESNTPGLVRSVELGTDNPDGGIDVHLTIGQAQVSVGLTTEGYLEISVTAGADAFGGDGTLLAYAVQIPAKYLTEEAQPAA
jgi:hypothetical protein